MSAMERLIFTQLAILFAAFVETVKAINAGVSLSLFKDCNNVELEVYESSVIT